MPLQSHDSRATSAFHEFFRTEAGGGALLVACACAALVVANSWWADTYHHLLSTMVVIGAGGHALSLSVHQWINDGLMAVFFLLVGLEIKREVLAGELTSPRQAALPIAAAIGGMAVPALIYVLASGGGMESRGWAIPMATDIAFALGVLALVAPRAPSGLKIFLAALAIVDDLGAVVAIAIFYTGAIAWTALGMAGVVLALLVVLNRLGVRSLAPYLALGLGLWFFVHESGVHATIAGVLLAMTIPAGNPAETSPLLRLEHALHGVSSFVIMPLFAFSNAGVSMSGVSGGNVTIAIILGLAVGKPLGIAGAAFAAVRLRIASLPDGVNWAALGGCACLGGIGFTMSLFIATLAFHDAHVLDSAKVGIMSGSVLAGIAGALLVTRGTRAAQR
jgi:Na+:H+ antiporter, NhaA family